VTQIDKEYCLIVSAFNSIQFQTISLKTSDFQMHSPNTALRKT